ncbi:MAG: peptidase [Gemmatimonadetes bacterium]|nr:peptidase [Gemmatimonadota bacterium]
MLARAAALVLLATGTASAQTKLLRFPDIHGDRITFSHGGDIWTAPATGGTATRITSHPGIEVFAKFSPDGRWIAFTGQYDGDEQVYVVPSTGGAPKQLTWYPSGGPRAERWGYDNQVYGWTRDGSRILFRGTRGSWTLGQTKLYTVSPQGGSAVALPMPLAGSGAYSPDGRQIVYSKVFRDFRPEKRYSGGFANYLAIFDFSKNSARTISKGPRAERDAMWIGNKIYYNSDRDGTFNLYSYDVATGAIAQLTKSTTWDVRWPSADVATGRIIYEFGGELSVLDTKSGQVSAIHVTATDDNVTTRPSRVSAAGQIEAASLSPKGERAVFAARGDIFTVPIEHGYTRNLTHSSGAHDRSPDWSPDGSRIAYISDASGEEEVWTVAQDGSSKPVQLTTGGKAQRFNPQWSADNSRIAFSDKDGKLYVLRVADRNVSEIADELSGRITDYTWSPTGNSLAWSQTDVEDKRTSSIYVWQASDAKAHRVTTVGFNEFTPSWDPDGNYLFYLSNRDYQPQLSQDEFNYATVRQTGIFALALRRDVKNPFPMENDEVTVDTMAARRPQNPATPAPGAAAPATPAPSGGPDAIAASSREVRIDFDGIESRVARVPIESENIGDLVATKGALIYQVTGAPYYSRQPERRPVLNSYSLKDRKTTLLLDNAGGYAFSRDRKKVLVGSGGFGVYDVGPNAAASRKAVAIDGLQVDRDPRAEWNQIFEEVWRRYRDYFYAKNMHGYDWQALHDQYKPLVAFVDHRSDLNYVIQEMISELSVQHAYIAGGDWQQATRTPVALAGAQFSLDSAAGHYRISKIYEGQNEEAIYRSPLTELGVNAKVGEYVMAIDGEPLQAGDDPYRMLRGKSDRPVTLTLATSAQGGGSHDVSYRPVTTENDLGYLDMVLANQRRVSQLTGGKVGYIHIPDMGAGGLREFIKWYYPQMNKEGLVVDVRANGGGNISRMVIERLRRELLGVNYARTSDLPGTYPDNVFVGPMAAILDEYSSSDGDIFPYMFRQAKLGPLIGKRSWGGVVGINGGVPLIDGGNVNVPTSALASADGQWIIEGHGVDPDIEVENDAASVLAGKDNQLERAVQEVMKQMATKRHVIPTRPADKVRPRTDPPMK